MTWVGWLLVTTLLGASAAAVVAAVLALRAASEALRAAVTLERLIDGRTVKVATTWDPAENALTALRLNTIGSDIRGGEWQFPSPPSSAANPLPFNWEHPTSAAGPS